MHLLSESHSYSGPGFPGQSRTFADLYYNRYRDYDTVTGRYIQADPIGLAGGPSPYSYAMNNPLRYTDPTGEFVPILIGVGLGVAFEYFTNDCATAGDLLLAGAFGAVGGGVGGAGAKYGGRRLLRELWKDASGLVPGAAQKPPLSAYKKALREVQGKVGRLKKGNRGKKGSPQAGHDKKGYRLDPLHPGRKPSDPEFKHDFNWWDYTSGKRKSGKGKSGAVPIGD